MTPDRSRLDPLAPIALAAVLAPFVLVLVPGSGLWPWRLSAPLVGGGLGLASLARIRGSTEHVRGRSLAMAAAIAGLSLGALGLLTLAVVFAIFVATGSS